MAERERAFSTRRLAAVATAAPGTVEETVVHDPQGRPWLVATDDLRYEPRPTARTVSERPEAYETQVYYTARAGIRGFPTGHTERYASRADAVTGHLRWCLRVRHGEVYPDLAPENSP